MSEPVENAEYDRSNKTVYEQLDYLFDRVSKLENGSGVDVNTPSDSEPAGSADHPLTPAGESPTTPEQE